MFKSKSAASAQYIPSKSVAIKPELTSDVVGGDQQIDFVLPSVLGFIDPRETYVSFDLRMSGLGRICPDPAAGAHALFRDALLKDGQSQCTIENLEDYNASVALVTPFAETEGVSAIRQLTEGAQPQIPPLQDTLFYGANADLTGTATGTPQRSSFTRKTPKIQMRLQTGLFQADQIIPLAALQGLRLQIQTERPDRGCLYPQLNGERAEARSVPAVQLGTAITAGDFDPAGTRTTEFDIVIKTPVGSPCHFDIHDTLYAVAAGGGGPEETVGVITGFYAATATTTGIKIVRQVDAGMTNTFAVDAEVRYHIEDRTNGTLQAYVQSGRIDIPGISYTISNLEMKCLQVTPPEGYVNSMMQKSMSGEGLTFDVPSYTLQRWNGTNLSGLTQIQIPSSFNRVLSTITLPTMTTLQTGAEATAVSAFMGTHDQATAYQWVYGAQLVPSRKAPLARYGQSPSRPEALHLAEVEKALVNIGKPVRNLQRMAEHFVIARAWSRYGQTADLSEESLSLRIDYGAASFQKLFLTYIHHVRRVTISASGCYVST